MRRRQWAPLQVEHDDADDDHRQRGHLGQVPGSPSTTTPTTAMAAVPRPAQMA